MDWRRRGARRLGKEEAAVREDARAWAGRDVGADALNPIADDELALIFVCCHPALDLAIRVPLTLRSVCGLT